MSGQNSVEIIPGRLFWISDKAPPRNIPNSFSFCVDNELVYQPFCSDFGPLNIAMITKFVRELSKVLDNPNYSTCRIYHYTSLIPAKRANAALLMGAFQILVLHRTAQESWRPFERQPQFLDFRDAGYGGCTYKCTIPHCLGGLEHAVKLGWYDLSTFNVREYEFYEHVENGDWNWIVPQKFLAFACPANVKSDRDGFRVWTPEQFSELFHQLGVTAVVRLNNKTYEEDRFSNNGIRHQDLFFVDGSCPTEEMVQDFIRIAEQERALAVHCKAGLGRTGTLIGCYCMKHYGFRGPEFIGWARLCRPGSVLGPQQQFLCQMEAKCRKWGEESELAQSRSIRVNPMQNLNVITHIENSKLAMSPEEKHIQDYGDPEQAERLLNAKHAHQSSPNSPTSPAKKYSNLTQSFLIQFQLVNC